MLHPFIFLGATVLAPTGLGQRRAMTCRSGTRNPNMYRVSPCFHGSRSQRKKILIPSFAETFFLALLRSWYHKFASRFLQRCLQRTPWAEVLFLGVSGLRKCQRVGSDHLQWDIASTTGLGTMHTNACGIYATMAKPPDYQMPSCLGWKRFPATLAGLERQ